MLDIKLLRQEPEKVAKALAIRGYAFDSKQFAVFEEERKHLQIKTQELQNQRNVTSKEIGKLKASGGDADALLQDMKTLSDMLKKHEAQLHTLQEKIHEFCLQIPNIPHESVPVGSSEDDNIEMRKWGEPRVFDFDVKDHVDLGHDLSMMDFDLAAKIAGARFTVLRAGIAKMHRALIQFMLEYHVQHHGYQEVYVPYLVNSASLYGTSQLPKFKDDQFNIDGWDLSLIPTAEVPVTNMYRDVVAEKVPLKFVCHTPCFRSEAGSYGKDTRGLIRQHQFEKVEMVQLVAQEDSYKVLEELTGHAEAILQQLNLPYRVVTLCGGDIGFGSAKTYDLEVWLPGQQAYREISSCSNFEAFQARRMQARWRNPVTKKPELMHTLNGSGLAIGRTLVAIMENYQQKDGSVKVPEVLVPYMGGMTVVSSS